MSSNEVEREALRKGIGYLEAVIPLRPPLSAQRPFGDRASTVLNLKVLSLVAVLTSGCSGAAWCERFKIDCDAQGGVAIPTLVDLDADGFAIPEDCDDSNESIHPLASEICDGLDNDCNGQTDEGTPGILTWFQDLDRDSFGTDDKVVLACEGPQGFVLTDGDCDDLDRNTFPGAPERCDERDNDCDDQIDEGLGEPQIKFRDADGDGYGVESLSVLVCGEEEGWVSPIGDCNDEVAEVNPGAEEICNNGRDDNCDGFPNSCSIRTERSLQPGDGLLLLSSAEAAVGTIMAAQWTRASDGAIAVGAPDQGLGGEVYTLPLARIDALSDLEPPRAVMGIDSAGARLGAAVAPTGQLLGGFQLLAVGAPGYSGGAEGGGLVLLASSEAGYEGMEDYPSSYLAVSEGMELGASLVVMGTPTSSTYRLAAGAPGADDGEGAVFLFDQLTVPGAHSTAESISVLRDGSGPQRFGQELRAGDVDGDGIANLLVSSGSGLDSGDPLWLFDTPLPEGEILAEDGAVPILPLGSADRLGAARALFGDIDDDGLDDLVLGGPGAEEGRGSVWILPGSSDLEAALRTEGLGLAIARIDGRIAEQALGSSFAMAKLDEPSGSTPWLLIGAPGPDAADTSGAVYLFSAPIEGVVDSYDADGEMWMEAGLGFGQEGSLLPIGDMTGDGRWDLVFGLPGLGSGDLLLLVTPNF